MNIDNSIINIHKRYLTVIIKIRISLADNELASVQVAQKHICINIYVNGICFSFGCLTINIMCSIPDSTVLGRGSNADKSGGNINQLLDLP